MKFVLLLSVLLLSACQSIIDNSQKLGNQTIDLADSIEYVDESNLWDYIASHQELLIEDHPRVLKFIDWYKKHPDYLTRISERAQPYLYLVVSEVEKEGLPIEIALLPIIESDYYPFSFSHDAAVGLWQFIPSTGKLYGLDQDWWYEDRRDVLASTRAAVKYMKDLNRLFNGDWLLSIAAYNAGPGRVQKAIKANAENGQETDFWHLNLPKETARYVPKLLALAKIVKDPSRYNQNLLKIDRNPYLKAIELNSQFDLALIAQWTGLSIDQIYTFNPGLRRWATPVTLPYTILLPQDVVSRFENKLSQAGERPQISWARHEVKSGDSLSYLAKKYKTTIEQIKSVNELRSDLIRVDDYLIVPLAQQTEGYYALSEKQREKSRLNAQKNSEKVIYKVVSGDSLWKIAVQFDTTVNSLVRWNQLTPTAPLAIGKELVIWLENKNKTELAKIANTGIDISRKIVYTVRSGDNLSVIASKYNVKVIDIRSWNNLDEGHVLQPGEKLSIIINVVNSNLS